MAYLASHPNHVVLFGSQFEGWRDIRLPRGTPNRGADDEILSALRGISQPRAPDIIDFTDRVFYEIKTVGYAAEGLEQLIRLQALIGAISRTHGGGRRFQPLSTISTTRGICFSLKLNGGWSTCSAGREA